MQGATWCMHGLNFLVDILFFGNFEETMFSILKFYELCEFFGYSGVAGLSAVRNSTVWTKEINNFLPCRYITGQCIFSCLGIPYLVFFSC